MNIFYSIDYVYKFMEGLTQSDAFEMAVEFLMDGEKKGIVLYLLIYIHRNPKFNGQV